MCSRAGQEKNVFGLKGPRKMTVVMPAIADTGMPVDFQPIRVRGGLLSLP
jgi:hypothetical protein